VFWAWDSDSDCAIRAWRSGKLEAFSSVGVGGAVGGASFSVVSGRVVLMGLLGSVSRVEVSGLSLVVMIVLFGGGGGRGCSTS
jgi:hypothetical protein